MPSEHDKYRRYLRAHGHKALQDAGPVRDHIAYLREHPDGGMTCQAIADAAGVAMSVVSEIGRGKRNQLRDTIANKILAVDYRGVDTPHGAWMDPTGTTRRIEALYAIGMTCRVMADEMGKANVRVVWNYRNDKYVTARVQQKVKEMYDKLRYVDPYDLDIFPPVISRNKRMAKERGWAPPMCWDDDTIDDPNAHPEWTGACGSMKGVRLHRKHSIMPLCPPCKEAQMADLRHWAALREEKEKSDE